MNETIRILKTVRIDGQRAEAGAVIEASRSLAADLIRRRCAVKEEAQTTAPEPKKGRQTKAAKKGGGEGEQ